MRRDVLTRQIDYQAAFKQVPDCAVLMTSDFVIIDASEDFEKLTGRELSELAGRNFFDAFPANPRDREKTGHSALCAALTQAARSRDRVVLGPNEYDLEDRGRPGVFEERFWSGVVTPILGDDGQVAMIGLWGRDVTYIVSQLRAQRAVLG
jgi:PAS domain S-box-containing protein